MQCQQVMGAGPKLGRWKMALGLWDHSSLYLHLPAALEAEGAARVRIGSSMAMTMSSDGEASTRVWGSYQDGCDSILVTRWVTQMPGSPTQAHQSRVLSIAKSPHHARPISSQEVQQQTALKIIQLIILHVDLGRVNPHGSD